MSELDDLKKLAGVAGDPGLVPELRLKAVKLIGEMRTHDALLALLNLAGNDRLTKGERDFALKCAREVLKAER